MKVAKVIDYEERQRRCMVALVRDILSDKSISQITLESQHCALSVARKSCKCGYSKVSAIGFTDEEDEEYFDEEDDEECVI